MLHSLRFKRDDQTNNTFRSLPMFIIKRETPPPKHKRHRLHGYTSRHQGSGGYLLSLILELCGYKVNALTDLCVLCEPAADERYTREQSKSILDDSLQVLHLCEVSVGGSPRRTLENGIQLLHNLFLERSWKFLSDSNTFLLNWEFLFLYLFIQKPWRNKY